MPPGRHAAQARFDEGSEYQIQIDDVYSLALLMLGSSSCARMAASRADRPPVKLLMGTRERPIVLLHGFSGFGDFGPGGQYFAGVKAHYEAQGVPVYAPPLPPYAHSEERARFVAKIIDEALHETGADKVHLVAHSQGGIDARYAISEHGLEPFIPSPESRTRAMNSVRS